MLLHLIIKNFGKVEAADIAFNNLVVFVGDIPDDTDDIKSTKDIPSWKRMCYCILKNDHTCRFMGFGLTRQEQLRNDKIKRKYGEMINGK